MAGPTDAELIEAFWDGATADGQEPYIQDLAGDGKSVLVDATAGEEIDLIGGLRTAVALAKPEVVTLGDPALILDEHLSAYLEASNWPHRTELQDEAHAALVADLEADGFGQETIAATSVLLRAFADFVHKDRQPDGWP